MEPTDEQTPADSGAAATTEVPIENSADDTFDDERADGEVVDEQEPAELEGLLQKKGDQGALKLTTLTLAFFCIFFFVLPFSRLWFTLARSRRTCPRLGRIRLWKKRFCRLYAPNEEHGARITYFKNDKNREALG